MTHSFKHRRSS